MVVNNALERLGLRPSCVVARRLRGRSHRGRKRLELVTLGRVFGRFESLVNARLCRSGKIRCLGRQQILADLQGFLRGATGLKPATSGVTGRGSGTTILHRRVRKPRIAEVFGRDGGRAFPVLHELPGASRPIQTPWAEQAGTDGASASRFDRTVYTSPAGAGRTSPIAWRAGAASGLPRGPRDSPSGPGHRRERAGGSHTGCRQRAGKTLGCWPRCVGLRVRSAWPTGDFRPAAAPSP